MIRIGSWGFLSMIMNNIPRNPILIFKAQAPTPQGLRSRIVSLMLNAAGGQNPALPLLPHCINLKP